MTIRFLSKDQTPSPHAGGMIVYNRDDFRADPYRLSTICDTLESIGLMKNKDWNFGPSTGTPTVHFMNEEAFIMAKMIYAT